MLNRLSLPRSFELQIYGKSSAEQTGLHDLPCRDAPCIRRRSNIAKGERRANGLARFALPRRILYSPKVKYREKQGAEANGNGFSGALLPGSFFPFLEIYWFCMHVCGKIVYLQHSCGRFVLLSCCLLLWKQENWGISSSGRAFGSQSKGSGFESHMLHKLILIINSL